MIFYRYFCGRVYGKCSSVLSAKSGIVLTFNALLLCRRTYRGDNLLRGEVWERPMPACSLSYYLLLK
jgi:hypothetical protein